MSVAEAGLAEEVRESLTRELRELPPKLFYDAAGSQLFDRITRLPDYYPTRAETEILNRRSPAIVAESGARELVELGSGTASKTRALLYAMAGANTLESYVPFDVDRSMVDACAEELTAAFPGLSVTGVVGDFVGDLGLIPDGDRRLFAFLGGTIGNLVPDERTEFLGELRELMDGDDRLLVGMDLVKDPAVIEAAYDDAEGITAEFNRNALRVVNDRLDGDFVPDRFEHVAFFDTECSWIEMRLRSVGRQSVRLRGAGLELELEDGEEIRTEISAKFTPEAIEGELAAAGLRLDELLTDRDGLFGLARATRD